MPVNAPEFYTSMLTEKDAKKRTLGSFPDFKNLKYSNMFNYLQKKWIKE